MKFGYTLAGFGIEGNPFIIRFKTLVSLPSFQL